MSKDNRKEIWKTMKKLYGNDGHSVGTVEIIDSGSNALNDILGVWGLARGRIIQFAGKESSGKTLMSLITIKQWQKLDPNNWAIFVDAEYTYDEAWAEQLGIDNSRVFLIRENSGVEIFNQLCGVPHKEFGKPKKKPGILDLEKQNPSGLGIVVIDSIAAVVPPIVMTKEVGKINIAPMARFLPDALPRIIPLLSQTGIILVAINQVRVDVGKLWGDPTSTPGGKALKHYSSVMIHFTSSESKKTLILDDNGETIGHVVGARIDKNKVGTPRRTCSFRINYTKGVIDKHMEIGNLAIKYGVVNRPNKMTYEYDDKKWIGLDNYYEGINNEKLMEELLKKIKENKLNKKEVVKFEEIVSENDSEEEEEGDIDVN